MSYSIVVALYPTVDFKTDSSSLHTVTMSVFVVVFLLGFLLFFVRVPFSALPLLSAVQRLFWAEWGQHVGGRLSAPLGISPCSTAVRTGRGEARRSPAVELACPCRPTLWEVGGR